MGRLDGPKAVKRVSASSMVTSEARSRNMASIRSSRNMTTELRLVAILRKHRITGWRRNIDLPGKPDFCFTGQRVVVFVDGCFWHGCARCYQRPQSNPEYWESKLLRNRSRDRRVRRWLRSKGWSVLSIWEHSLKREASIARRISRAIDKRTYRLG